MQKMYSEKREKTLSLVQSAIDEIQEDNRIVTKKELMELTGLSSGTFSQPYIKECLKENQVCQYRSTKSINKGKCEKNREEIIFELTKERNKLASQLQSAALVLEKESKEKKKLKVELASLTQEHQQLRGKYQQLLEYLEVLGADLTKHNLL